MSEFNQKILNLSAVTLIGLSACAGTAAGYTEVQRSYAQGAADAYTDEGLEQKADDKKDIANGYAGTRNVALAAMSVTGVLGIPGIVRRRREVPSVQ